MYYIIFILVIKISVGYIVGLMSVFSDWFGDILVFFYVVINKGNVYNWSIGKFIVFIDGIYVFFVVVNVYVS